MNVILKHLKSLKHENTEGLCFKLLAENKKFLTYSFFKKVFKIDIDSDIELKDREIYFSFWCDKYGWYTFWVNNSWKLTKTNIGNNIDTVKYLKSLHGN